MRDVTHVERWRNDVLPTFDVGKKTSTCLQASSIMGPREPMLIHVGYRWHDMDPRGCRVIHAFHAVTARYIMECSG